MTEMNSRKEVNLKRFNLKYKMESLIWKILYYKLYTLYEQIDIISCSSWDISKNVKIFENSTTT